MNSQTKIQLFLLHFAGGSSYSFDFLRSHVSEDFDFLSLEIPGRGKRMQEELLTSKQEAIQDYVNQIKNLRNKQPYIIYGHSLGATLGLSVADIMQRFDDPPLALVVSGNPGPGADKLFPKRELKKRSLLGEQDFKNELRELGGVPEEVLENSEVFNFFSPIIRADFKISENDNLIEEEIKLQVPIYALMGSEEQDNAKISNWQRYTFKQTTSEICTGNHFFIHNHPDVLAKTFLRASQSVLV